MIYLVRSSLFDRDVRGGKYHNSLMLEGVDVNVVCWNRLQEISAYKGHFFNRQAPFGKRWKNIWNVILWQFFLLKTLWSNRKNYKVIHVADLDSALPCLCMKLIGKKVFYDVYDLFCDSYFSDVTSPVYKFFKFLEAWIIKKSDLTIIADHARKNQIQMFESKVMVVENVPALKMPELQNRSEIQYPLTISYTGTLQEDCRGIEHLLEVVSKYPEKLNLILAGDGQLKAICEDYSSKFSNIIYVGRKSHDECLKIMANSDYTFAAYYPKLRNNIFAAPNKYYEALMVGTPVITNKKTYFGDKIEHSELGFVFEPDIDSLKTCLLSDDLLLRHKELSDKCLKRWNKDYANYVTEIIHGKYVEKVKGELSR